LVRIYIYRGGGRGGVGKCKKKRKRKQIGTWEGTVVNRHQRRLHKTYEGVEVGSYDPQLLIHASCLVQFRTKFRKLLLHRHTNTSSPRKNTLLSLSPTETVLSIDNRRVDFRNLLSEPNTRPCSLGLTNPSVLTCEVKYLLKSYLLTVVPCF